jgi:hypothetical protein
MGRLENRTWPQQGFIQRVIGRTIKSIIRGDIVKGRWRVLLLEAILAVGIWIGKWWRRYCWLLEHSQPGLRDGLLVVDDVSVRF